MKLILLSYVVQTLLFQICLSFLYPPFNSPRKPLLTPDSDNVGKPLILTPLLESKRFAEARQRSSVHPLMKDVTSNAGYFTVEPKYNSNLFFWFFRAKDQDWQKAPLLLWLQGGPGCTSLFGLFNEHGPFFVVKGKLRRRKYAWTNQYNLLYIDQPVGTGYSFTNSSQGLIDNQEKVADHLYKALSQFFLLYPELKKNKFYITGESYAGKYVPAIAFRIHKLKMLGKCDFNLKGLFIVSAFSDPISMLRYSDFAFKIGLIDLQTKSKMSALELVVESYIHSGFYKNATYKWFEIIRALRKNASSVDFYNYNRDNVYEDDPYYEYVQSAEIRKKIHVGNITYDECSDDVYEEFLLDFMQSTKLWIEELLEHLPVAFVGGQLDVLTAYPLVSRLLQKLRWSGAIEHDKAKRQFLYDGNQLAGYYKTGGNLKDIFIRRAGHMAPADQPRAALKALQMFIDGKL